MVRPKIPRFVTEQPRLKGFAPKDTETRGTLVISVEEFEAIRLSDYEKLNQEAAAQQMGISRHTFGRLLGKARQIIAEALVTGKELTINGGHYEFREKGRRRHRRGCGKEPAETTETHKTHLTQQQGGDTMPAKDGTGPQGKGRRTGKKRNGCGCSQGKNLRKGRK